MSAEPPKKRGREDSPPEEEVPDEVVIKVEEQEFPCKKSDFGLFLKIIDGTGEVTDENIQPLLRLAQYLEASGAERKCLQFLMVDSEKVVKVKFQLADRYRLEPLIVQILSDIHTPEDLRAIAPLIDVPTWNHKTLNHVLQKMYSLLGLQGDYYRGRADAEPVHVQIQQPQAPERAPQEIQNAAEAQANQPRQPTPPNRVPDGPLMVREARTLAVELAAFLERHQNPQNLIPAQTHIVRIATQMVQVAAQNRLGEGASQNQGPPRFNVDGLPVENQDAQGPQPNQVAARNQANQPRQPAPLNRFDDEMKAANREQHQNQQNLIQAQLAAPMAQVAGQAQHRLGEVAPQNQAPRGFSIQGLPVQNQDARGPQLNQVVAQALNQANQPRQPAPPNGAAEWEAVARQHRMRGFADEQAANREQHQNRQNPFLQRTAAQQVQIQEASQNQAPRRCITHGLPVQNQNAQAAPQPIQAAAQAQAQNQAIQSRQPAPLNRFDVEMRAAIREQIQNPFLKALLPAQTAQIVGQAQNRLGGEAPLSQAPRGFNIQGLPVQNQDAQAPQPNQVAAQAQNQAIQPRQPAPLNRFDVEMRAAIRKQTQVCFSVMQTVQHPQFQNQQNQIQAQLAVQTAQVAAQNRLGEGAPQNQAPRRCITHGLPVQNQDAQAHQPNRVLAQNPYYIARRAQIVQPIVTGDAAAREHAQRVFLAGNRNPVLVRFLVVNPVERHLLQNQQNPAQAPYQAYMPRQPSPPNHAPMLPAQVPASVPALNRNVLGPNRPVTDNGAVQNPVPQNQIQPVQPAGEQLIQLLLPEDRALGAQLYATLEAMQARSRAAHVEAPNPQGQGQADQVAARQEPAE
ncbi:hypothetical protein CAEBREN_20965 [Caenorhabditis brenneri]|uniref:Uncharacterized protein n=1 Tax=Caenorhabditis brenneri TaxID=135651 RepID=G0MUX9_CAEBE|nr:hypothetical protein CAEBREN_20965 [Caenorhabditis brenneri]